MCNRKFIGNINTNKLNQYKEKGLFVKQALEYFVVANILMILLITVVLNCVIWKFESSVKQQYSKAHELFLELAPSEIDSLREHYKNITNILVNDCESDEAPYRKNL